MGEIEFGLIVIGAFNDGIDDVSLTAELDLLANELPDFFGVVARNAAGEDGGPAGRQLIENADIEVAVEGEREVRGMGVAVMTRTSGSA